jgi:hypothetical protein
MRKLPRRSVTPRRHPAQRTVAHHLMPAGRASSLLIVPAMAAIALIDEPEPLLVLAPQAVEPTPTPVLDQSFALPDGCILSRAGNSWALRLPPAVLPNDFTAITVSRVVAALRPRVVRLADRSLWHSPLMGTLVADTVARDVSIVCFGRTVLRLRDPVQQGCWRLFAACVSGCTDSTPAFGALAPS